MSPPATDHSNPLGVPRTSCLHLPPLRDPSPAAQDFGFRLPLGFTSLTPSKRLKFDSGLYSDRKACTASTLAARAAGKADAITAAPRMTAPVAIKVSAPGLWLSAMYLPTAPAEAKTATTPAA